MSDPDATHLGPAPDPDTTHLGSAPDPDATHLGSAPADTTHLAARPGPASTPAGPDPDATHLGPAPADTTHLASRPDHDATHLGSAPDPNATHLGSAPDPDKTHLGQAPADTTHLASRPDPDATHLGSAPDPNATRLGPAADPNATHLGASPADIATHLGSAPQAPPPSPTLASSQPFDPWAAPAPAAWRPEHDPTAAAAATSRFAPGGGQREDDEFIPYVPVPRVTSARPVGVPEQGFYEKPATPDKPARAVEAQPKRRFQPPRWAIAVAAGLALVMVGGLLWYNFRPTVYSSDIVVPSSGAATQAAVARGDLAVRGYLEALAEGDIDKALSYGPVGTGSTSFLNSAGMKQSLARTPLTDIVVPTTDDPNASQISASYTLGNQAVSTVFRVAKADNGNWHLQKSTTTVRLDIKRDPQLPLLVNGQPLGESVEIELVPGSYAFTTGLPFLDYDPATTIVVQTLEYANPLNDLPVILTEEGQKAVHDVSLASVDSCKNSQELAPAGCPFRNTTDGRPFVPGSIVRTLTPPDPMDGAPWSVTSDQITVEATVTISYTINLRYNNVEDSGNQQISDPWTASIDASVARAADMQVAWKAGGR